MAFTIHSEVSCAECSRWTALYDWEGNDHGGLCEGCEWFPKPKHGTLNDLSCHSLYERMEEDHDRD